MTRHLTVLVARHGGGRGSSCAPLLRGQRGIRVVATARDDREVLTVTTALRPSLVVLDAGSASRAVTRLVRAVRARCRATRVIVLVGRASETFALDLLSGGAHGYLDPRLAPRALAKAVRCVGAGEPWIPRRIVPRVVERLVTWGASKGPPSPPRSASRRSRAAPRVR